MILSEGILQYCPLCGSLFVIAISPLLIALEGLSPDQKETVVTACADDIGMVLQQLLSAIRVAELFALFEKTYALQLKKAKCVIVPAGDQDIASFQSAAADLLAEIWPTWSSFAIKLHSVYLGLQIGPAATPETR